MPLLLLKRPLLVIVNASPSTWAVVDITTTPTVFLLALLLVQMGLLHTAATTCIAKTSTGNCHCFLHLFLTLPNYCALQTWKILRLQTSNADFEKTKTSGDVDTCFDRLLKSILKLYVAHFICTTTTTKLTSSSTPNIKRIKQCCLSNKQGAATFASLSTDHEQNLS